MAERSVALESHVPSKKAFERIPASPPAPTFGIPVSETNLFRLQIDFNIRLGVVGHKGHQRFYVRLRGRHGR
jgi:hypothetical protein